MPSLATIGLLCLTAAALIAIPGPAVLYIVSRSVSQGRAAGLVSCLGISTGGMVHVLAAALGVSALLASSAVAFSTVKYLGAAYLVLLGIRRLRRGATRAEAPTAAPDGLRRVYAQGALVNVLNPKAALFFLAFLPQFVDPSRGHAGLQALVLGVIYVLIALVNDSTYALVAAAAGRWLGRRPGLARRGDLAAGGICIALGTAAAFSGSSRHA